MEAKAGRLDGKPEASERRGAAAAGGLLLIINVNGCIFVHERLPGVVQVQPIEQINGNLECLSGQFCSPWMRPPGS